MVFYNFLNFFAIFLEFSITSRVGIDRNDNFSLFLDLSQPVLAWKEVVMKFFSFLSFFAIFLKFSNPGRAGTDWNDNFCFLFFSMFPTLFWLEKKP